MKTCIDVLLIRQGAPCSHLIAIQLIDPPDSNYLHYYTRLTHKRLSINVGYCSRNEHVKCNCVICFILLDNILGQSYAEIDRITVYSDADIVVLSVLNISSKVSAYI